MISPELHKKPVALDRNLHRSLKLRTDLNPLAAAATLNSAFVTAAEFGDACKDYPILFVRAGTLDNGKPQVAPMAILGLQPGENLFLTARQDGQVDWSGRYVPAMLRAYPFTMAKLDAKQWAVCIDESWTGWSPTEGRTLFNDQGEPSDFLEDMRKFTEQLESEIERTRAAGERLIELNLLQDKRFDAKLPDGSPFVIEGFLAADEKRLAELSDVELGELHRSGLLGMLMTHQVSLGNMRVLLERRLAKTAAST